MTKTDPLFASLDDVIAHFGPRRVLLAALRALLHHHARHRPLAHRCGAPLDDHIRRDIGLPPRSASPPISGPHPGW